MIDTKTKEILEQFFQSVFREPKATRGARKRPTHPAGARKKADLFPSGSSLKRISKLYRNYY